MYMIYSYVYGIDLLSYSKTHEEVAVWEDIDGIESDCCGSGDTPIYIGKIYGSIEPTVTTIPQFPKQAKLEIDWDKRRLAAIKGIVGSITWGRAQNWPAKYKKAYEKELTELMHYINTTDPKQFIAVSSS